MPSASTYRKYIHAPSSYAEICLKLTVEEAITLCAALSLQPKQKGGVRVYKTLASIHNALKVEVTQGVPVETVLWTPVHFDHYVDLAVEQYDEENKQQLEGGAQNQA